VDSARALAERLVNANPAQLGIAGTRDAVLSVRRTLQDIDTLRGRIEGLKRSGEEGINRLKNGIAAVDQARQKDYAFARSLLQLPSFAAPDIGAALFGPVSIERFEKAVYWAELAQRHLPPGLAPQSRPAPKRLRMDGTDVAFPRERAYPSFLLRDGAINVAFSAFGGTHTFEAKASGITSQPALYGRPAMVSSSGRIGGSHPMNLLAGAVIDHTRLPTRDSARARLDGVPLPNFSLPGLPFRVEPGAGSSDLAFSLRGNQVAARWALRTENAIWQVDSTGASKLGTLEGLIWRVLSGLRQLDVTAELKGSLRAPQFSVHSNIDQAIADQVKSLLGEEVQAAEKRVRAEVDKLVAQKVEEVGKQVDLVTTEARTLVTGAEQELNTVKAELESRLKSLTGGLGGVLR
jgi:uncharacterized protein (TIGR03545 family)